MNLLFQIAGDKDGNEGNGDEDEVSAPETSPKSIEFLGSTLIAHVDNVRSGKGAIASGGAGHDLRLVGYVAGQSISSAAFLSNAASCARGPQKVMAERSSSSGVK